MSIRSKDLSYDKEASQPAFLQRLRAQNSGIDASGRHERQQARPQRLRNDEEDDAPTYILQGSSEVLSKAEYDKLASSGGGDEDEGVGHVAADDEAEKTKTEGVLQREGKGSRQGVVDAGTGAKKRKVAKVVGGGDDDDDDEGESKGEAEENKPKKKPKKKANAVKLSFGDE